MTYRFDLGDGTRQMTAVHRRYADDHPDYDRARHTLTVVRLGGRRYEITGHADSDPRIEAIMARCCCHPDQPRGREQ